MRYSDDTVLKVRAAIERGMSVAAICRRFKVSRSTVERWRELPYDWYQNQEPFQRFSVGKLLIPEIAQILRRTGDFSMSGAQMYALLKAPDSKVKDLSFCKRTVERALNQTRPLVIEEFELMYLLDLPYLDDIKLDDNQMVELGIEIERRFKHLNQYGLEGWEEAWHLRRR